MTDISCPNCGSELCLTTVFSAAEDQAALARLITESVPLGAHIMRYTDLHAPAKQRLTAAKRIKLVRQLLPDLERWAISHKGRTWSVTQATWEAAIDQLLQQRDAGRLELPLKGHGYLYAVLAGMADKAGEQAEQQRDQELRNAARPGTGTVAANVSQLLGAQDPALAALQERDRRASPMPEHIRQRMAEIKRAQQGA